MITSANIQEVLEELWDEHSFYVDDDLSSLDRVAGTTVITGYDYKKLMEDLKEIMEKNETK